MTSRRMNLLDRPWRDHFHAAVASKVDAPTLAELRESFVQFITEHPDHAIAGRISADQKRWVQVPAAERRAHAEQVFAPGPQNTDPQGWLNHAIAGVKPQFPLSVYVGDDTISISLTHMSTDGASCSLVISAIARNDFGAFASLEPHADLAMLLRAAAKSLREFGSRWWATFRGRDTKEVAASSKPPAIEPTVWTNKPPAPTAAMHRLEPATMAALNAWRKSAAEEMSLTSLLTSAVWRAFAAESIPVSPDGFTGLFDLRRFLPAEQQILAGNLAKAIHVQTDMGDPAALHRAVQASVATGRALPAAIIGSVSSMLPRRAQKQVGPSALELTFSSMPALPGRDSLPWSDPDNARYGGLGFPTSATGISAFSVRIGQATELFVSFDARTVDPAAVARALARLDDIDSLMS